MGREEIETEGKEYSFVRFGQLKEKRKEWELEESTEWELEESTGGGKYKICNQDK